MRCGDEDWWKFAHDKHHSVFRGLNPVALHSNALPVLPPAFAAKKLLPKPKRRVTALTATDAVVSDRIAYVGESSPKPWQPAFAYL
jgi:hypothetical protein